MCIAYVYYRDADGTCWHWTRTIVRVIVIHNNTNNTVVITIHLKELSTHAHTLAEMRLNWCVCVSVCSVHWIVEEEEEEEEAKKKTSDHSNGKSTHFLRPSDKFNILSWIGHVSVPQPHSQKSCKKIYWVCACVCFSFFYFFSFSPTKLSTIDHRYNMCIGYCLHCNVYWLLDISLFLAFKT